LIEKKKYTRKLTNVMKKEFLTTRQTSSALSVEQCSTDDDRRQHLENEAHGKLHDTTTKEEKKRAINQENSEERRTHHI
jgi:hypothetical protein